MCGGGGHRARPARAQQEPSVRGPGDVSPFGSLQPLTVLPLGHTCGQVCFCGFESPGPCGKLPSVGLTRQQRILLFSFPLGTGESLPLFPA